MPGELTPTSKDTIHIIENNASVSINKKSLPEVLPQTSGPNFPQKSIADAINELGKHPKLPGVLGQLTNNAIATFKMTRSGLREACQLRREVISKIDADDHYALLPYLGASLAVLLYGGSLLAGAAIKAALWLPVIGVTATIGGIAGGMAGALAFILSGGDRQSAKEWAKGSAIMSANIFGGVLTVFDSVVASLSIVARSPIMLLGWGALEGLAMLSLDSSKDDASFFKEWGTKSSKLFFPLYMTIQDSLGLWTGYEESVWRLPRVRKEQTLREIEGRILSESGANLEAVAPLSNEYVLINDYESMSKWGFLKDEVIDRIRQHRENDSF